MIIAYEVKKEKKEEILILHLEYREEFGKDMNNKRKKHSLKQEITDFLKLNSIKWNGNKILIMCGGISLGLLLYTKNPTTSLDSYQYIDDSILLAQETIELEKEEIPIPESSEEIIIEEKMEPEITPTESTVEIKETNTENTVKTTEEKEITPPKEEIKPVIEENKTTEKTEVQQETKEQQVQVIRTNGTIVHLNFTDYLIGVVAAEMPASFQIEALKAQSVVARTYALKRLEEGKTLTDSVTTQSYKDNNELKNMWGNSYSTYYQKIKQAVEATKNMTIQYQGEYIDAVYHSTSNGKTEDSKEVWGNSVPYLKSVDSSWDIDATPYLKTIEKEMTTTWTLLGIDFQYDKAEVLTRNESGRVTSVQVGNKSYSGVELRNLLGLRSADFDITIENGNLTITTRGYGHGVGMSQYGANGMAKNGYTYQQIIKHYYTGVTLAQQK